MDQQRFDNLTRSLAVASRRSVLRVLGGGVAAAALAVARSGRGSAQSTLLPLGSVCTFSGQCSQGPIEAGAVACADNGLAGDGPLNCCRFEGGCCDDGADCCGALACIPTDDGLCGAVCLSGTPATGLLSPGAPCSSTVECAQPGGGDVVCDDNGITSDGGLNCCRYQGGICADGTGCCGSLFCIDGICGGSSTSGLLPGAACTNSAQCLGVDTICADNGITFDGGLNCCRSQGGTCADGTGCCGALLCIGGVCGGGSTTALGFPGDQCSYAGQCDQSGGETDCADNGLVDDGPFNCCRYSGGTCAFGAGCCGGLLCIDGICQ